MTSQLNSAQRNHARLRHTAQKALYTPPALIVYGTVQELTKMIGHHGNDDGAQGMNHRTQV